jgi:hypothetical protein
MVFLGEFAHASIALHRSMVQVLSRPLPEEWRRFQAEVSAPGGRRLADAGAQQCGGLPKLIGKRVDQGTIAPMGIWRTVWFPTV